MKPSLHQDLRNAIADGVSFLTDCGAYWVAHHDVIADPRDPHHSHAVRTRWQAYSAEHYTTLTGHIPDMLEVPHAEVSPYLSRLEAGVITDSHIDPLQNEGRARPLIEYSETASRLTGSDVLALYWDSPTQTHKDWLYERFFEYLLPQDHNLMIIDTTRDSNAVKAIETYLLSNQINRPLVRIADSQTPSFSYHTKHAGKDAHLLTAEIGVPLSRYNYTSEELRIFMKEFFSDTPDPRVLRRKNPQRKILNMLAQDTARSSPEVASMKRHRYGFMSEAFRYGIDLNDHFADCSTPFEHDLGTICYDYKRFLGEGQLINVSEQSHLYPLRFTDFDFVFMTSGAGKRVHDARIQAKEDARVIGLVTGENAVAHHYGVRSRKTGQIATHISNPVLNDLMKENLGTDRHHGHVILDGSDTLVGIGAHDVHWPETHSAHTCHTGSVPAMVLDTKYLHDNPWWKVWNKDHVRWELPEVRVSRYKKEKMQIPSGSKVLIELSPGNRHSSEMLAAHILRKHHPKTYARRHDARWRR
ncbi:MAG: hypothetical protein ACOCWQ_03915 [Nanoarchaeota archaeon]